MAHLGAGRPGGGAPLSRAGATAVARFGAIAVVIVLGFGAIGSGGGTATPNDEGTFVALDPATGSELWRVASPGLFDVEDVSQSVVVGRGYACDATNFEYVAYRASDGKRLWRTPAPVGQRGSRGTTSLQTGSARSGVVVLRSAGHLEGRDARTGDVRWRLKVAHNSYTEANATKVVVSTGPTADVAPGMQLLDRKTGAVVWSKKYASNADSVNATLGQSIVVVSVTVASQLEHAEVLDVRTGALRWRSDRDLTPTDESVVVSTEAFRVPRPGEPGRPLTPNPEGQSARDGARLWEAPGESSIVVAPGFFGFWRDTTPFGGAPSGTFSAADPTTGAVRWSRDLQGQPLVSQHLVVTASSPGEFDALDAETGATRWQASVALGPSEYIGSEAVGRSLYVAIGCPEPSH